MKQKKIFGTIIIIALLLSIFVISIYAANVGDNLTDPESGWTRYHYNNSNITYFKGPSDVNWFSDNTTKCYLSYTYGKGYGFKFNFIGSSLRILSCKWPSMSSSISVKIDGTEVGNFSQFSSQSLPAPVLTYEITGLTNTEHYVEVINNQDHYLSISDIDVYGTLQPYNEVVTPEPTPTPSPEPTPEPSPEPTPTPSPEPSDNALLIITMVDNIQLEYNVTTADIDAFKSWYNNRANGVGSAYYEISKNIDDGPFTNRKDYIVFDKIIMFEIDEYN